MDVISKPQPLPLQAAQRIKEMIVKNGMKPGDRLPTEVEFSKQLGLGRSTIREAMKYLRAENVITITQGKGTFVSDYTGMVDDPLGLSFLPQDSLIEDLYETRIVLEQQITRLAAERATTEDIEELEQIVSRMVKAAVNDLSAMNMDIEFHNCVARCCKNQVLQRIMPIIVQAIEKSHLLTKDMTDSYESSLKDHVDILDAIRRHDTSKARFLSEKHVRDAIESIRRSQTPMHIISSSDLQL
ncbi:FadR/GntR family transcriptional regulator [Anaerolentibacter hominis]|uniref:FadR/GntR family transcriptional regulator n=1 Tax=Anaerolentibacter hominis TaxID=3079009 RepID=UPI0031B8952D